jgi:hypothetical protein
VRISGLRDLEIDAIVLEVVGERREESVHAACKLMCSAESRRMCCRAEVALVSRYKP